MPPTLPVISPGVSSRPCRVAGKVETGSRGNPNLVTVRLASAVRQPLLLASALVLLGAATGDRPPPTATGFTLAAYPLAKCLDGSPGRYYFRPAAVEADADRWLM